MNMPSHGERACAEPEFPFRAALLSQAQTAGGDSRAGRGSGAQRRTPSPLRETRPRRSRAPSAGWSPGENTHGGEQLRVCRGKAGGGGKSRQEQTAAEVMGEGPGAHEAGALARVLHELHLQLLALHAVARLLVRPRHDLSELCPGAVSRLEQGRGAGRGPSHAQQGTSSAARALSLQVCGASAHSLAKGSVSL